MLYRELIKKIGDDTGLTAVAVDTVITRLSDLISQKIKESGRVRIAPLGIFESRSRSARTGRNPSTGDPIRITERSTIGFRSSAKLRARTFGERS